jgi:photosystem II stability/assembly factor-like uncharacterized protein
VKKKWAQAAVSVVLLCSLAGIAAAAGDIRLIVNGRPIPADVPPQNIDGRTMVPIRWVAEALGAKVDWDPRNQSVNIDMTDLDSSRRQDELLSSWIAPQSAQEAADTWAKAVQRRNGAVQYSLLSDPLKDGTRSQYEAMNWVSGLSSPWVDSYQVDPVQTVDGKSVFDVTFALATSTGSAGSGTVSLSVVQSEKGWEIAEIRPDGGSSVLNGIVIFPESSAGESGPSLSTRPKQIRIADASTAFVWTEGGKHPVLWKTSDGGQSWSSVPLDGLHFGRPDLASAALTYFLDADHGWIGWSDSKGMNLARTGNGGKLWEQVTFPGTDHPVKFSFINEREGWLLTSGDAAMMHSRKKIYHTGDGGKTWELISGDTGYIPGDSATPDALPQVGISTSLVFRNAEDGFVTMDNPVSGTMLLYRTRDGGKSWRPVSLTAPEGISGAIAYSRLSAPVFSGGQLTAGIMPAMLHIGDRDVVTLYRTEDGGASWRPVAVPDPQAIADPDRIAFADADHGWAVSGDGRIMRTNDGGESWQTVQADQTFARMMQSYPYISTLAFQSDGTGWVLCATDDRTDFRLMRTEDGGVSWNPQTPASSGTQ